MRGRRAYIWVGLICVALLINLIASRDALKRNAVKVSDATLPLRSGYYQLATVGNHLLVTGGAVGGTPSGLGTCTAMAVDALTLKVTSTVYRSCGDPGLYGQRVLPVSYVTARRSPLFQLALKIAILAPHTGTGYRLGPVVLRYPQCSSCRIESVYGDGSLWVYSPFATPSMRERANSGELFRVSERSGRVVERWMMPTLSRSLLAVDDDGLWIAQSTFGGTPAHLTADERIAYRSLYRVAPGMREPVREFDVGSGYWMVAARHTVWLDAARPGGNQASTLWRLSGPSARPLGHRSAVEGFECAEMGEGQPSTAGDAQTGIDCIVQSEYTGHIQEFDAATGASHEIAVPALKIDAQEDLDDSPGPAVVLGGSVFFLVGESRLFKVATS